MRNGLIVDRWICKECETNISTSELLQAENPFKKGDEITGCPKCFSIDSFVTGCDEPGCKERSSSGWPSPDGYRWTCHKHYNGEGFKL